MHARTSLFLSLFLFVGCADLGIIDSGADVEVQGGIKEMLPLEANDVGPFDLIEGDHCGAGYFLVKGHARGTGTIIGRYRWETDECFDPVAGTFAGTVVITSDDGGSIQGRYEGVITGGEGDLAYYAQTVTVTGGTGRFKGTSGTFETEGEANLATLIQTQVHSGEIANPGTL